jgi:hypothetical protein
MMLPLKKTSISKSRKVTITTNILIFTIVRDHFYADIDDEDQDAGI